MRCIFLSLNLFLLLGVFLLNSFAFPGGVQFCLVLALVFLGDLTLAVL